MSGMDSHGEWTWLRPVAALAAAIAAGAGTGVGTAYFHAAPSATAQPNVIAEAALSRRVTDLEAWREAHDRDVSKRWESADQTMSSNRGDIERLRGEVTEANRRIDRMMERSRANGGGSAFVEPLR